MSCSVNTMVSPVSRAMPATIAMISCRSRGAMPAVGSSSSRSRGALARAIAISSRRWSPWARMPLGLPACVAEADALEERQRLVAVEAPGGDRKS